MAGDGDDWGPDEELAEPRRRVLPGNPWLRRGLLLAAVTVIAVAVALQANRGRSVSVPGPPTRYHDHLPVSSTEVRQPPPPIPLPSPLPSLSAALPGVPCPDTGDGEPGCSSDGQVPASFLAAVRDVLPEVVSGRMLTETLRPAGPLDRSGLWSRSFRATAGEVEVDVEVRTAPLGGGVTARVDARTGRLVSSADDGRIGHFYVRVAVSAASGGRLPSAAQLARLCHDARLVAL